MSRRSVSSAARKLSSYASGALSPSQTIRARTAVSKAGRSSTTATWSGPGSYRALCRRTFADTCASVIRSLGDAVPASDRPVVPGDGLGVRPGLRQLPSRRGRVFLDELLSAEAAAQELSGAVGRAAEATPSREFLDLAPLGVSG